MSWIYTPAGGGYTTQSGKFKERNMLVLENEERKLIYRFLVVLQRDVLPQLEILDWNQHDKNIIPGIAEKVAPIHRGGHNSDITTQQLDKLWQALVKVERQCPDIMDIVPRALEPSPDHITPKQVKQLQDARRMETQRQEELKQNPDLITDTLPPFRHIWHWWHKHKARA